jgi:hypothetical protein
MSNARRWRCTKAASVAALRRRETRRTVSQMPPSSEGFVTQAMTRVQSSRGRGGSGGRGGAVTSPDRDIVVSGVRDRQLEQAEVDLGQVCRWVAAGAVALNAPWNRAIV